MLDAPLELCWDTIVIIRVQEEPRCYSFDAPFFMDCVIIWLFVGVWRFLLNEMLLL